LIYVKKQLAIVAGSYTPFVVPVVCSSIVFRNTSPVVITMRTDPNDATTTDVMNPNDQEVVPGITVGRYLFAIGQVVGYFQSNSGNQNILVTLVGE
jgi:hypothetical protein